MFQTSRCLSCAIFGRKCHDPVTPSIGSGSIKYVIVGEAPGRDEVTQRVPFVGASGKMLKGAADKAGIPQDQCLFTNTVWCAPVPVLGERIGTPTPEECASCLPHALGVIASFRPRVIIAVGAKAYQSLCPQDKKGITRCRGHWNTMSLTIAQTYPALRFWMRGSDVQSRIMSLGDDARVYYGTEFDTVSMAEQCEQQIARAVSELGYSTEWISTPVMPIVHPAALLRGGQGTMSQAYEDLVDDLRKAKDRVDGITATTTHKMYRWILDLDDLTQYVDETISLHKQGSLPHIAVDCETSRVQGGDRGTVFLSCFNPDVRILTVQVSRRDNEAVTIMLNHRDSKFNDPVSTGMVRHHLHRLLTTVPSVYQNAFFDLSMFKCKLGIEDVKIVGDTLLAAHWLTCGSKQGYGLDELGARYLGTGRHKTAAHAWNEKNPGKDFDEMPLDIALDYASGDADVTRQVWNVLRQSLAEEGRWDSYWEHYFGEHQGWKVLHDLTWYGMPVDREALANLCVTYPAKIAATLQRINEHPDVIDFLRVRYKLDCAEREEHNAGCATNKRRKRKEIQPFDLWVTNPDNQFSPSSVPATVELWRGMRIPEAIFGRPECADIEYTDEDCPTCGRRCRCSPPHKPVKFKTSEANRTLIANVFRTFAARYKALNRPVEEAKCERYALLMDLLSEFKTLDKLNGTYVEGMTKFIVDQGDTLDPTDRVFPLYRDFHKHPRSWLLHPSYNMHGTATGRLSSSAPNAQNFPSAYDEEAGNVKAPYVSRWRGKGGLIVQPDFSQIEVRVVVALACDTEMARILNGGKDVHRYVASLVHGIPEEQVTDDLRKPVKRVTFGILYGQSVESLAVELHITTQEAKRIQTVFFSNFPRIQEYISKMHTDAVQLGYVQSPMGRRRYLGALEGWGARYTQYVQGCNSKHQQVMPLAAWMKEALWREPSDVRTAVGDSMREAVNTPIQGLASDLCWQAYGRVWSFLRSRVECCPHSIIHDSQAFDVSPGRLMDVVAAQYYHMVIYPQKTYPWMIVRPEADFSVGSSWGSLCNMKLFWSEDKKSLSPEKIGLSGGASNIDLVCQELYNSGTLGAVISDGPHPKEAEAKKGKRYREVALRVRPVCTLVNEELLTC